MVTAGGTTARSRESVGAAASIEQNRLLCEQSRRHETGRGWRRFVKRFDEGDGKGQRWDEGRRVSGRDR